MDRALWMSTLGQGYAHRRIMVDLSQAMLGAPVGLTNKQIQKYERGDNRIAASRLWAFSKMLGVSVDWFFDGLGGKFLEQERETFQFIREFEACPLDIQKTLAALIRAAGKPDDVA